MMFRTHLAFGVFLALLFLPSINSKVVFIGVILVSSLLPDIDSSYSYLGHRKIFRPLQFFVKHRGALHSLTIAALIAIFFSFYWPVAALPFFLGYAGHLFMDSLSFDGVRPFWPIKKRIEGSIRVGGTVEKGILYSLGLFSLVLFVMMLF